jgi:hypothetical protein
VQAAGRDSAEADQHRLAPRRAERTEPRLAHDLATEAVGQDQPFFGRQQSKREIARNREIEALPTIPLRQFETLKKEIEVDFADLEDADRLRLLNEFTASYVERQDGAATVFELHDTRFGGQPKVGIVADTFRGNSGSPVFDRDNHCIAGILTGGAPDLGQRLGASWQFHETVLPMPAILADLKESEPTATLLETGGLTIR